MKKFKLKALFAVLAMSAGSAFAVIPDGTTGNGGLFLEVYDAATNATYIRDLGISMNDFGTTQRPTGGFANNVNNGVFASVGNGAVVNGALTFTGDANWATFLSGRNASTFSWEVLATDFTGTGAADGLRALYTTTNNDQARQALAGTLQTNASLANGIAAINNQLASGTTSINALLGSNQSMITTTTTDTAFATFLGSNLNGFTGNLNTLTAIDTDAFMTYMTRSSTANNSEGIWVTYAGTNPFPVKLAGDGTLTFGTVTAVPEPGTWAMLLAGLMMVGGIARRRLG